MIEDDNTSNNVEDIINVNNQNDGLVMAETDDGEKNKFGRKRNIFIICIIVLLDILILYNFNNNSYGKFVRAFKNENSGEAIKIFNELENEKDRKRIENYLIKRASYVKDKFINNSINYDEASDKFKIIESIGIVNKKIPEDRKFIENLHDSRIAYDKVLRYFEEGKFKDAIKETKNVIKEDINYNTVLKYKNDAMAKLEDEVILNSNELASNNDFIGAINLLDDNKSYIGNKNIIEDLIIKYKGGASNEIIRKAVEKTDLGSYDEALNILNTNIKYSSNNNIQEKINEIKQKKKEYNKNVVLDIKKRIVINYDDVEKEYKIAPKGYIARGM